MKYEIIATGSKGNAVVINEEILIDCGVPYKKLEPHVKNLKLVLLTHQHGDHFKPSTIRALHRERPPIRFGCCEWMVAPLVQAGVDKRMIDVFRPRDVMMYFGLCFVEPIPLIHDVQNCGYSIGFPNGNNAKMLFYATDTGTLDGIEAKNYDLYLVEANHSKDEIEARAKEKMSRGEFSYEFRAAANHLSYEQAIDWLAENAGPNSEFVLLHQHNQEGTN